MYLGAQRAAISCIPWVGAGRAGTGARPPLPAGTERRCLAHLWSLGCLWLQRWQGRPPLVTALVPRYLTPLSMIQVRT